LDENEEGSVFPTVDTLYANAGRPEMFGYGT
jgi:hypothetical protein